MARSWAVWKKNLRRADGTAMSLRSDPSMEVRTSGVLHPNDVDRKRIERVLEQRQRYRYVTPQVRPEPGGYRIESPCCSRTVDKDGGLIDIARLGYLADRRAWRLDRMDHGSGQWVPEGEYATLTDALQRLNEDAQRVFWR